MASRRRIGAGGGGAPPTSIVPGASVAPHSSTISRAATAWASSVASGDSPFSKRAEASLRSPSRCEVRWMLGPSQVATSIRTRVVSGPTSLRVPPMIPARLVGTVAVEDHHHVRVQAPALAVERLELLPLARAPRTTSRPPATRSRSKACSGWPVSSIT